jgi:hypothetical protein
MSAQVWESLTNIERAFFVNAQEIEILPGVFGDLNDDEVKLPLTELAATLLSLIDRGWIDVCRYDERIGASGRLEMVPGRKIPTEELPALLADPGNWDYFRDVSWNGKLKLLETDAGKKISRMSPDEMAAKREADSR